MKSFSPLHEANYDAHCAALGDQSRFAGDYWRHAKTMHNPHATQYAGASTTMIYTHVFKVAAGGTASPLDVLQALVV
jgi:hypothetical protein